MSADVLELERVNALFPRSLTKMYRPLALADDATFFVIGKDGYNGGCYVVFLGFADKPPQACAWYERKHLNRLANDLLAIRGDRPVYAQYAYDHALVEGDTVRTLCRGVRAFREMIERRVDEHEAACPICLEAEEVHTPPFEISEQDKVDYKTVIDNIESMGYTRELNDYVSCVEQYENRKKRGSDWLFRLLLAAARYGLEDHQR